MKNTIVTSSKEIYKKLNSLVNLPAGIWRKRTVRIGLPVLTALLFIMGLFCHARISDMQTPFVREGVLDLSGWDGKKVLEIAGQWEFYWDRLFRDEEIKRAEHAFMLVDAPDNWNSYQIDDSRLPGKGKATYRVCVIGVVADRQYGIFIGNMESPYRLYIDGTLVAQNGSFDDTETTPSSGYRPQLISFTSMNDSFDMVLQMSNDTYGIGGMWQPVIFGAYEQVAMYDRLLYTVVISVMAGLVVSCLFFLIFFAAQRGEKDALILSILSILVLLRLSITGNVVFSMIFPNAPVSLLVKINFLTLPWAQFFLQYFIYCVYGRLVSKWQVTLLFTYTIAISLIILLFPMDATTSAFMFMNYVLLFVMTAMILQLIRAAWQGQEGARLLLFALLLIVLLIFYEMFLKDRSIGYDLLRNSGFEYMVFIFAQMAVIGLRYRRAQKVEIAHLKGQIRPHFIHNALTSIISISRNDPDRSRELLVDFSSYLRGFYDYERDELISFTQELELVQAYVALEQARFGEKLRVKYCIEEDEFLLPSLMLQPLVENAFVHGLREKDNGGTVTIYAGRTKSGMVRVSVRDDGVGFSQKFPSGRQGVGIENINRRLSRFYRTSLVYLEPEEGGCEVYFDIPYKEAKRHEGMAD